MILGQEIEKFHFGGEHFESCAGNKWQNILLDTLIKVHTFKTNRFLFKIFNLKFVKKIYEFDIYKIS